jgi:hypothetical protein
VAFVTSPVDEREGAADLVAVVAALAGAVDVPLGVARLIPSETDARGRWEAGADLSDATEPDGDTTD